MYSQPEDNPALICGHEICSRNLYNHRAFAVRSMRIAHEINDFHPCSERCPLKHAKKEKHFPFATFGNDDSIPPELPELDQPDIQEHFEKRRKLQMELRPPNPENIDNHNIFNAPLVNLEQYIDFHDIERENNNYDNHNINNFNIGSKPLLQQQQHHQHHQQQYKYNTHRQHEQQQITPLVDKDDKIVLFLSELAKLSRHSHEISFNDIVESLNMIKHQFFQRSIPVVLNEIKLKFGVNDQDWHNLLDKTNYLVDSGGSSDSSDVSDSDSAESYETDSELDDYHDHDDDHDSTGEVVPVLKSRRSVLELKHQQQQQRLQQQEEQEQLRRQQRQQQISKRNQKQQQPVKQQKKQEDTNSHASSKESSAKFNALSPSKAEDTPTKSSKTHDEPSTPEPRSHPGRPSTNPVEAETISLTKSNIKLSKSPCSIHVIMNTTFQMLRNTAIMFEPKEFRRYDELLYDYNYTKRELVNVNREHLRVSEKNAELKKSISEAAEKIEQLKINKRLAKSYEKDSEILAAMQSDLEQHYSDNDVINVISNHEYLLYKFLQLKHGKRPVSSASKSKTDLETEISNDTDKKVKKLKLSKKTRSDVYRQIDIEGSSELTKLTILWGQYRSLIRVVQSDDFKIRDSQYIRQSYFFGNNYIILFGKHVNLSYIDILVNQLGPFIERHNQIDKLVSLDCRMDVMRKQSFNSHKKYSEKCLEKSAESSNNNNSSNSNNATDIAAQNKKRKSAEGKSTINIIEEVRKFYITQFDENSPNTIYPVVNDCFGSNKVEIGVVKVLRYTMGCKKLYNIITQAVELVIVNDSPMKSPH
ncbi:hypothetical protein PPL_03062 [Heterostelium album PN500]|uniref:Uncharacterized protein n=1 Tax=Heterostelium pallidum (strain ATCC 26659 / Pp 5 / PN500) TaxID=670386 RepID=D3B3U1_HETP5|nr:hypothetical protein PPL_03062 [Heterostelium album PN500]EFA83989.1 hypothetical protein PPL_03062 [Heterostelium album PN500]|eukprot:XP_020436106.1 hypothetical protein PPL_03062 [Heterostelium album PN500]